jgi:hypothetical protein
MYAASQLKKVIMNIEQFEEVLIRYRPKVNELIEKYNYSLQSAERIVREYTITRKSESSEEELGSTILNLIDNYDVSTLNIFDIRFWDEYEILGDKYIIGYASEYLMILNKNGSIQGVNISDKEEVVWEICKDSDNFLLVLTLILEYNQKIKDERANADSVISELLTKLLPVVGGENYILFYKYMFDID